MEHHQVIIIGGGPAGAACAKALVNADIDVLLLEKSALPRYKCCSGVLFGQTQKLLKDYFGALPPEHVCCEPRIINSEYVREWSADKGYKRYLWEIDKDGESFPTDYINIWRNKFDHWLLEMSGCQYRDRSTLKSYVVHDDHLQVKVKVGDDNSADGVMREYQCEYLVGADGGGSRVRQLIPGMPSTDSGGVTVKIYQVYYQLKSMGKLKNDSWTVFFEPSIGEMLSCVHRKDDQLLLCVGGFKGRRLTDSIEVFKNLLIQQFDVKLGDAVRTEGCNMKIEEPYLGSGRILLAGEAAGHVYLNGEGISAAIDAGYRAGRAIAEGMINGDSVADRYQASMVDIHKHISRCLEQIHFLSV
jgi:flavin-dependent dehydrogenase